MVRYVRFYTRWHRRENDQFSTLRCTKTGSTQPKLSAACFVVQSCLADADFVVFSNYCLIGTRQNSFLFCLSQPLSHGLRRASSPAGAPFGAVYNSHIKPALKGEVDMSVSEWTEGLHRGCTWLRQPLSRLAPTAPRPGSLLVRFTAPCTISAGRQ